VKPIYFDYNATTPILPPVAEAMAPYLGDRFGNPSSGHAWGILARTAVANARTQVAGLIGCAPDDLVFTSCATESINTVLKGLFWGRPDTHLVTTAIEHPATLECASFLEAQGSRVTRVAVDDQGVVSPDEIRRALRPETTLVSIMLANNETGALQPVAEVAAAARERGIPVHCDAAQAVGKIPVNVRNLGVDFLSVAGHKLYAPKGVGALYVAPGRTLPPLLHGGGQERGLRSGTENVSHIVGLGAACELAAKDLDREAARQEALGEVLLAALDRVGAKYLLHSAHTPRLPQTLFIGFHALRAVDVLSGLVGYDVAVSGGAACHGAAFTLSHVLQAMNADPDYARGTIRFSWGRGTSREDVDEVAARLALVLKSLRDTK
jgi:cysteine desulfurase